MREGVLCEDTVSDGAVHVGYCEEWRVQRCV